MNRRARPPLRRAAGRMCPRSSVGASSRRDAGEPEGSSPAGGPRWASAGRDLWAAGGRHRLHAGVISPEVPVPGPAAEDRYLPDGSADPAEPGPRAGGPRRQHPGRVTASQPLRPPADPWALERAIRSSRTKVPGLSPTFRYHDLGHSFASMLIASGMDVKSSRPGCARPARRPRWTRTATCGRTPTTAPGSRSMRCSWPGTWPSRHPGRPPPARNPEDYLRTLGPPGR